MRKFLFLYCPYDSDNYRGHCVHEIATDTEATAKQIAKDFLDTIWVKCNWEFRLVEITGESHYRLWDTRDEANKAENDYTTQNYWEA